MPPKKQHAQYFTTNETLQHTVFEMVRNKNELLLEPSFGAGHLLREFLYSNPTYPMHLCEIDAEIIPVIQLSPEHQKITHANFLECEYTSIYRTIVGNPPYAKRKGLRNIYIDFVEKCFRLLDPNGGEMVFIIPSEFFKMTRAAGLITEMCNSGAFTDFVYPNDETLFEGASIDVVVFRYVRGISNHWAIVNGINKRIEFANGIITFSDAEDDCSEGPTIGDICDVFVGIVSGRDDVFRMVGQHERMEMEDGIIHVLADKDVMHKYIMIQHFPSNNPCINEYLLQHKLELMSRRIRRFDENNWFEWGALRNIEKMRHLWGRPCIYVRTLTRQDTVAFKGTVQYFGGSLICIVPKDEPGECVLDNIVNMMNSDKYRNNYVYSGRFKIGQKQVSVSKTNMALKCI